MRRRLLVLTLAASCFVAWACGFPDVEFAPGDQGVDGGDPDTGLDPEKEETGTGGTDGGPDGDSSATDGSVIFADASLDAIVINEDAGNKVDAAGCTTCDCDKDGFSSKARPGCVDASGADDCDDSDSRTHPTQDFLRDPAVPPRNGDWDCSGKVDKLRENFNCASQSAVLADCSAYGGFTAPVACGAKGSWLPCANPPLLGSLNCVNGIAFELTQVCK